MLDTIWRGHEMDRTLFYGAAVALQSLLLCCCGSEPRTTRESPAPRVDASAPFQVSTDGGSAAESSREIAYPMPSKIQAHVHLPGPNAERHLSVTIQQENGSWLMSGCVSSVSGSCFATSRVTLGEGDTSYIRVQLALVFTTPVSCAEAPPEPGDREYRLTIDGHDHRGFLPADITAVPACTSASVCQAMNRLAWWIAQRFEAGNSGS